MNTSVLVQPSGRMTSKAWEKPRLSAARAIAAPAYPPIRAWEEEVGRPHHQVRRSHTIAPARPAITTYCVTSSSRIMPLPMVLATAVPRKKAATKLKNAAQITANLGESTRVETTVAMLLAASWKPLRKSKIRAVVTVTMSSSNPVFTGGHTSSVMWCLGWRASGAFQGYPFQNVGCILGLVRGVLQNFVQLFDFDELDGIFFVLKKFCDGFATYPVGFIFKPIDLYAVSEHILIVLQQRHTPCEFFGLLHDKARKFCRGGWWIHDPVHIEAYRRRVHEIEYVVQR